ncbi:MAG: hypothetical protein IKW24_05530 [Clostridia bacterium]|nr:hypothetical protein [Clostridia bacterium]
MKFYEAPDFTKIEFFTENVLDGSTGNPIIGNSDKNEVKDPIVLPPIPLGFGK